MTIFLPSKINVGFQKREGTYTGQLAYVIYYDQKGKLRKEASWNSWRDKDIPNQEFDNTPIEGFVLNKKVGGYDTGWNHRNTYCRVFDPRGFEIEICVENLLYILENTNSIKGKGLEGKFIYGWDGTELVLIPEAAPEFLEYKEFTDMITNVESIKGKDLVPGGTYRSNQNIDYIYLGRFDFFDDKYDYAQHKYVNTNKGKYYFFIEVDGNSKEWQSYSSDYLIIKSLSNRIVKTVNIAPAPNYADLVSDLEGLECYSPYDPSKDTWVPATVDNAPGSKLYFSIEGVGLTADCVEGCTKSNYPYESSGMYHLEHLRRRSEPQNSIYYHGYYRDYLFLKKIKEEFPPDTYKDYNRLKGIPLEDLLKLHNFTVKKEFLANGKERKR